MLWYLQLEICVVLRTDFELHLSSNITAAETLNMLGERMNAFFPVRQSCVFGGRGGTYG